MRHLYPIMRITARHCLLCVFVAHAPACESSAENPAAETGDEGSIATLPWEFMLAGGCYYIQELTVPLNQDLAGLRVLDFDGDGRGDIPGTIDDDALIVHNTTQGFDISVDATMRNPNAQGEWTWGSFGPQGETQI